MSSRLRVILARLLIGSLHALLVPLSALAPRRPDFWLFGHRDRVFAGNARYLFLWLTINRPDIRCVWIADNEEVRRRLAQGGFTVYRRWSMRGVLSALRAKVFVFCHGPPDVNTYLSGGAILVNLWHGVGIKATMFGDTTGPMSQYYRKWNGSAFGRTLFFELLRLPDIVATTSDFTERHFARQFEISRERCPQIGYPRLDPAFDANLKAASIRIDIRDGFRFNPDGFGRVILYVPTWRDTGRPFLTSALPDLNRLSHALRQVGAVMYVKLHPWTQEELTSDYDNIRVWPHSVEMFTYFAEIDSLVTDYSSVLYDFLYSRSSGIVLYTFDLEEYERKDRTLLYPFNENTVGLRLSSFEALCDAIAAGRVFDECSGVPLLREKFWGPKAEPASNRVVEYIEDSLAKHRRIVTPA